MIDQREVQHLIKQNKKIKAKIVEQARVYQEERAKLKFINRSLQKTLEEEKERNRATIEEFNNQIIALEAELRRVKSNEPQVTPYTTPRNRPLKPISFAQLEAESKRLAEETNRIIQQSQKPSTSVFYSTSPGASSKPYQTSKIPNIQNYRTQYQFNLSDNNNNFNSTNFIQTSQKQKQFQSPPQQQFQQHQFQQPVRQSSHSKTQQYNKPNNENNFIQQENDNIQQISKPTQQRISTLPNQQANFNQQTNSNTFPFSSNQQMNDPAENIIIEEEEEVEMSQDQMHNVSNHYSSDDTVPANEEKQSLTDSNNSEKNQKISNQPQQNIEESPNFSQVSSNSASQQSSNSKGPKQTVQKDDNQNNNKVQNPSSNTISVSNNDKKPQVKADQKAATSPGISVVINDESKNSDDPFADNFLSDNGFGEEDTKSNNQEQKKQEPQQIKPAQEKTQPQQNTTKSETKQPPQKPASTPKADTFMNEISSAIFDDISFNHDVLGSELDMEAAFNAPSQTVNNENDKKEKKNDAKDKKDDKKNEVQEDDIRIPSAGSWSFPSSQIQIEGFE